jgi:predicted dehydrogenase
MIEKPLDATVEGTDQILHAAAKAGVRVGSIFQARFGDGARAIKAAVEAGRFGRMVLASCYVKWNRTAEYYTGWKGRLAEDGGGAVMNQAIHGVDLLQWLAGMPSEVFAWATRRVHAIESEDTAVAALRFGSGAFGTLEASTALWPGLARRVEICGENGSAVLEDDDVTRWDFRVSQPEDAGFVPRVRSAPRARARRIHGHQFRRASAADPGFHRRHPRAAAVLHRRQRSAQGRGAGARHL